MKHIFLFLFTVILITACSSHKKVYSDRSINDYRIAYNVAIKDSSGKTNYEVFTMNTDGSEKINISNNPAVDWTYRGYGRDLYFVSDMDTCYRCFFLYKTDADGGEIRKVSDLQLEDSWMDTRSNGKEMIVSGRIGKDIRYQLFIINTENGSYRQITQDTAALYRDPVFSLDGKQIVCSYKKYKRDRSLTEELFIMNEDGTGLKQLTHYPENNISFGSHGYKAGAAHWHPTGIFISFISMRDGLNGIYAVTPDGKKEWKLTGNKISEGWHDWSADGKWLVFDSTEDEDSPYHIMLMNRESREVKQLTGDSKYRYHQSPVFILKK